MASVARSRVRIPFAVALLALGICIPAPIVCLSGCVSSSSSSAKIGSQSLTGTWLYRSFHNNPNHEDDINKLLFGEGELVINQSSGELTGSFDFGSNLKLTVKGTVTPGNALTLRFTGTGLPATGTDGWIYDYFGVLIPGWPEGVEQKLAIVGSVIRTVSHSGGRSKAGVVASFIAVKRN